MRVNELELIGLNRCTDAGPGFRLCEAPRFTRFCAISPQSERAALQTPRAPLTCRRWLNTVVVCVASSAWSLLCSSQAARTNAGTGRTGAGTNGGGGDGGARTAAAPWEAMAATAPAAMAAPEVLVPRTSAASPFARWHYDAGVAPPRVFASYVDTENDDVDCQSERPTASASMHPVLAHHGELLRGRHLRRLRSGDRSSVSRSGDARDRRRRVPGRVQLQQRSSELRQAAAEVHRIGAATTRQSSTRSTASRATRSIGRVR